MPANTSRLAVGGKQNTYKDQVAVNTSSRLRATNPFRCRCNIGGSHFWLTKKITCIEAKHFVKCQIALSSRGKHLKHTRVEQVELQIVNRNTEWEPSNRKLWHHISYWLIASFKTMTLCIWAKRVRINSFRNSRIYDRSLHVYQRKVPLSMYNLVIHWQRSCSSASVTKIPFQTMKNFLKNGSVFIIKDRTKSIWLNVTLQIRNTSVRAV